MVQARWALALILLLVALPDGGVRAAPWRPWAVALEREPVDKEAPQEDHQAVPVPGENTGAVQPTGVPGPEYRDGRGQSSQDTSKVLHEILGQLKTIARGVNSLSLNSAVDGRRFTSAVVGRADPNLVDGRTDPIAVVGRADPNAVDGRTDPNTVDGRTDPNAVVGRADPNSVGADTFQTYCIEGIVAVLGSILLGMALYCVFHLWRKRRRRLAASRAGSERPNSRAEASRIFAGAFK
ncbi:uncharacterized protein LOC113995197 [Pipra filicauda]|uniref:Uncharacterized protein LOC113995197 n=1 Tax=Pipra filicauda TaxID=649802 RepID=A0A7R5KLM4_9PASS|nr:uncharacterized protein LOC113995197 [Pipra filicauda]